MTKQNRLRVTVQAVMSWKPCGWNDPAAGPYSERYVRKLFGRRRYMTALDIAALDIPIEDMFWAIFRPELIDAGTAQEFADYCADWAVERFVLECGIPYMEEWAVGWLSGKDRSEASAMRAEEDAMTEAAMMAEARAAVTAAAAAAAVAVAAVAATVAWAATVTAAKAWAVTSKIFHKKLVELLEGRS